MVSAATNLGANAAKRYLEVNTAKATRATEELASGSRASNPSYDPASSAVGYRLTANVQSLAQAANNVAQATAMIQMATGSLGASQDVLTRLKELTVKANTNTVGDSERKMMNEEFQQLLNQVDVNATNARWGGVSLFSGGAGAATHSGAVTEAATGLTAVANAFTNALNATNTQGNIDGYAVDATVVANGALYDVSVDLGDGKIFKGTVAAPVANSLLTLTAVGDPSTSISFTYDATVTAITDAATFQTSLRSLLGIGAGATRASFVSLSTNAAAVTGGSLTLNAGSGTSAGKWALSSTYDAAASEVTFRVSKGTEYYTATVAAAASMTTTVSFSNGINLTLNAFNGTAALAQETWNVAAGTSISQSFQYGEKATDMLQVTFRGANVAALGLSGLNIITMGNAQAASLLIDGAQDQLGSMIAELGGKASQLGFMADTLKISIQNQSAARSTFIDANIAESMLTLQRFKGLASVASSVFTQALNEQANLTSMVQQLR